MEQRYEKPSGINPTCANQRRDQDLDAIGGRLNGTNRYTVTFAKDQTPPVNGFWSLTLYNEHHFFAPNEMKRFSLGTKNKNLKYNSDGPLTLLFRLIHRPQRNATTGCQRPAPIGRERLSLTERGRPQRSRRLTEPMSAFGPKRKWAVRRNLWWIWTVTNDHRPRLCLQALVAERPIVLPPAKQGAPVMERNGSRYQEGLENCLSKASSARTPELKELWHTMADSYRCLVEYDKSAMTFHSWQRNNTPSSTE